MPKFTGISHVDLTVSNLERSVEFYSRVLGAAPVLDGRSDEHQFTAKYLFEPTTSTIIGLVQHDAASPAPFDPRVRGLDHLSFGVSSRDDLEAWERHLTSIGVPHEPISDQAPVGAGLNFTDPDGIPLEFYHVTMAIPTAAS
jgi:glyoxylase I family protein